MEISDFLFRYVGNHRRTKLKDVLALKAKIDAQQAAIEALAETQRTSSSVMQFEAAVARIADDRAGRVLQLSIRRAIRTCTSIYQPRTQESWHAA